MIDTGSRAFFTERDLGSGLTTMDTENEEVRMIDAASAAPERFARGWHCVGLTRDLRDGKPHPIHAFGTKLVGSRTARAI